MKKVEEKIAKNTIIKTIFSIFFSNKFNKKNKKTKLIEKYKNLTKIHSTPNF